MSNNLYKVCEVDISMALDHMAFRNRDDSFATFDLDARFIRDKGQECSYCDRPAVWSLVYKGI